MKIRRSQMIVRSILFLFGSKLSMAESTTVEGLKSVESRLEQEKALDAKDFAF
jgi:hypothetical protein